MLEFRARVLLILVGTSDGRATLIPDTVLLVYSCNRGYIFPAMRLQTPARPGR